MVVGLAVAVVYMVRNDPPDAPTLALVKRLRSP